MEQLIIGLLLVVWIHLNMFVLLLPPRSYGGPVAAAAVDRLLMMGIRMPETC